MSTTLGWFLLGLVLIQILGWGLFYILHMRTMGNKSFLAAKKSNMYLNWGSRHPRKYTEWLMYKGVLRERRARARATGFKRLYYIITDKMTY